MPTQFDYRSTSSYPADEVYATMVDPDYLRARLEQIGGPGAGLLEHTSDTEGARYRLRHGVDPKNLPSVVRTVLRGDVVIERAESWKREGMGNYTGDVQVAIPGTPGSAGGVMRLRDTDGGSELHIRIDVTVDVPFLGAKIEEMVSGHVKGLLASESAFTQQWLGQGR
jgi:Protein of unknown function (DUF2505)